MDRLKINQNIILYVLLLVFIAGLSVSYFFVIQPLNKQLDLAKASENDMKSQLDYVLAAQEAEKKGEDQQSSWAEQNKEVMKKALTALPVSTQIQQILRELEKAENKSSTVIKSLNFTKIVGENTTKPIDIDVTNSDEVTDPALGTEEEAAAIDQVGGNIDEIVKNADLQNLVDVRMDISLEADDYYEIRDFIQAIENASRKMTLVSISFQNGRKVVTAENLEDLESIVATLSVSTFFVTGFDELKPYMPVFKLPQGAGKTNPFPVLTDEMIQSLLDAKRELEERQQNELNEALNSAQDPTAQEPAAQQPNQTGESAGAGEPPADAGSTEPETDAGSE